MDVSTGRINLIFQLLKRTNNSDKYRKSKPLSVSIKLVHVIEEDKF
jgi:hypothetical protein